MTDQEKLRKLAEKATPGPWNVTLPDDTLVEAADKSFVATTFMDDLDYDNNFDRREATADYIAAANPHTVLSLLDTIAALQAERDGLREALSELAEVTDGDDVIGYVRDTARYALEGKDG